jgi:hypothetical protein
MKLTLILLSACSLFFLVSCAGVEACSDPLARNFDAEADVNCCCQYFQLRFNISQEIDTSGTELVLLNAYPDAAGDFFQIKNAVILLSAVKLIDGSGNKKEIDNQIEIPLINGSSVWVKNDFTLIRPGTFIENIGDFTSFADYDSIQFLIGLNEVLNNADASKITDSDNPLSINNPAAIYDSNSGSYSFGKWEIIKSNIADTTIYSLNDKILIQLPIQVSARDGVDTEISIRLNYAKIFEGISFQNDDALTVIQKIKTNLPNAFSVQ